MSILSALKDIFNGREITVTETLPAFNTNVQTMYVRRLNKTTDGIFGVFTCDYCTFKSVTVENLLKAIAPGRYRVSFDNSPRLGYITPHLAVLDRDRAAGGDAGIRIHKANEPTQLEGCIAPGTVVDGDAVDWSEKAFNELMLLTDQAKETWIEVSEAYSA